MKLHRREKWLGAVMAGAGLSLMLVTLLPQWPAEGGHRWRHVLRRAGVGNASDNFNPYAPSGANAPGTKSCLYQSLYYFNAATGAETPLLGRNYKWTDGNLQLVVTTRSG